MMISAQVAEKVPAHILVVDDEAEICRMVASCLEFSGFRVSSSGNAAEAYDMLEMESYDAIVTDVKLPGEDGISFLGRIRGNWSDIPVVLMTGHAQMQMAVDALKNGAFDFVHKPFDYGHMRRIVERAVNYTTLQRLEKNYRLELEETVTRRTAELKEALVELDFAKSALLKRATQKTEFMTTITHEMRTPMNGVIGGLSLLEDEISTANGKEYFAILRQSADNMVALIDQLLTFGDGEDRKASAARYDLISLSAILSDLVTEFKSAFIQKGISLTLLIAADVPHNIWTDKGTLCRLLGILIGNALKFSERGAVTLAVSHEERDGNGKQLYFSVSDSGIGIQEELLKRIFDPFVQGDGSLTRRHGGVGLGLAIARQNALILKGRLWAEQLSQGGSRFTFSMEALTPEF